MYIYPSKHCKTEYARNLSVSEKGSLDKELVGLELLEYIYVT